MRWKERISFTFTFYTDCRKSILEEKSLFSWRLPNRSKFVCFDNKNVDEPTTDRKSLLLNRSSKIGTYISEKSINFNDEDIE